MKLAVITSHPIQYQVPLWRLLGDEHGIDLEVLYPSLQGAEAYVDAGFNRSVQWDVPLLDGYRWRHLTNRPMPFINWRFRYRVPSLLPVLKSGEFTHVLLVGKEYAYYHQALRAAHALGLRVLYRAESHPPVAGRFRQRLATLSRRAWYRRIDAFLCVGRYQFAEYAAYGAPRERMFFSPYGVDNRMFEGQRRRWQGEREAIRQAYGFPPDAFVVGYAGKLHARKNPLEVIRAFADLPANGRRCGLLMVGDGPMRPSCEVMARAQHRGPAVLTGFLNQTELGRAYVAMDVFVVPSLWETWGLAVNEAMLFHLPVVTASGVNAARDLIDAGENGYCYASGDLAALKQALLHVAARTSPAGNPMGEAAARRVAGYSLEQAGAGIAEALRTTVHRPDL